MANVRSDGVDIFYEMMGSGAPVLLLHPFPSSHESWLPVARQLAARYQVILPDHRALGRSGVGEGPATMELHARAIAAILDDLHIARAALVGSSIGGYMTFEFWRRSRERVTALGLVATRATPDNDEQRAGREKSAKEVLEQGPSQFLERMAQQLVGESTQRNRPDLLAAALKTMQRSTAAGVAAALRGMALRPDSTPTLPTINVPTMVLHGAEDKLIAVEEAQRMNAGIKGSSLHVIPSADHFVHFEKAEEVARLLRQFLDSVKGVG